MSLLFADRTVTLFTKPKERVLATSQYDRGFAEARECAASPVPTSVTETERREERVGLCRPGSGLELVDFRMSQLLLAWLSLPFAGRSADRRRIVLERHICNPKHGL